MAKEYEKDLEDYKKIKSMYEASLTPTQKEDIKRVKEEMAIAKEKRKLKAVSMHVSLYNLQFYRNLYSDTILVLVREHD